MSARIRFFSRHDWMIRACRLACALPLLALAGCAGVQSVLDPKGPQALAIARVSWVMFWSAGAILLLVMALALMAMKTRPGVRPGLRRALIVGGGMVFPTVTLTALLFYGVYAMGDLRAKEPEEVVEVIGHRWWWEIRYPDGAGGAVVSANELRIPAGRPVTILLSSRDVIHSFWVPNLAGKMDLIPGRTNRMVLQADAPGVFRGQCAEFCGAQHARMAFQVVAQEAGEHAAWLERERRPAAAPQNALAAQGQATFRQECLQCHTVRGVGTAELPGPDLTHLASRGFIGAGTLENNAANLAAFITRSQQFKPGSGMPSRPDLDEGTLRALVHYLETLE